MSANKKTVFRGYDYLHCDDFAKLLGEMAAKGWHFKEWGTGLEFEKGEPKNVTYAVEVFTGASDDDTRPEPHTKDFAEYCEAAGWKLVDARQKFCIFKKMDENAVDILTPEERVTNAYKSVRNSTLPLLILYGISAIIQWSSLFNLSFENRIFSNMALFNVAVWTIMFLFDFCKLTHLLIWKYRMKRCMQAGKKVYLGTEQDGKKKIDWSLWFAIVLLVGIMIFLYATGQKAMFIINLITLAAFVVFALVITKVRPETNTNVMAQIVFYIVLFFTMLAGALVLVGLEEGQDISSEEPPLLVEDYREDIGEIVEIIEYNDSNVFGNRLSYILKYEDNYLFYDVYTSKVDWIMDKIWEDQFDMKVNETREDCTSEWEAEIAYRNKIGEYYVRYEDIIFILEDYEDLRLTQDQINIIRDKLDLR